MNVNERQQKLYIEYMLCGHSLFLQVQHILKPAYFDPKHRESISFILNYYNKRKSIPPIELVNATTGSKFVSHDIDFDIITNAKTDIGNFCRVQECLIAAGEMVEMLEKGDTSGIVDLFKRASSVSSEIDLGVDYFEDPEKRITKQNNELDIISTGWPSVDRLLGGGVAKKELLLFSANSGGGKSISLLNIGYNFLRQKKDVMYLSLELPENMVASRFDQRLTGYGRSEQMEHVSEIIEGVNNFKNLYGDSFLIKWMKSGTRTNDIRAYLENYKIKKKKMPDLLIVDYLDKMRPNETNISETDAFTKDRLCAEQLRDLGVEYNMVVATASQLNRSAVKATDHDHSHIAGGISKVNESDTFISCIIDFVTNRVVYQFLKTRSSDGVGNRVELKWDGRFLSIIEKDVLFDKITLHRKNINTNVKKQNKIEDVADVEDEDDAMERLLRTNKHKIYEPDI